MRRLAPLPFVCKQQHAVTIAFRAAMIDSQYWPICTEACQFSSRKTFIPDWLTSTQIYDFFIPSLTVWPPSVADNEDGVLFLKTCRLADPTAPAPFDCYFLVPTQPSKLFCS